MRKARLSNFLFQLPRELEFEEGQFYDLYVSVRQGAASSRPELALQLETSPPFRVCRMEAQDLTARGKPLEVLLDASSPSPSPHLPRTLSNSRLTRGGRTR